MELYLSFSEIVRFFKRHLWKFAVVVVACGVVFGFLSLKTFKREYTATSTILVACTIDDNASPDYSNQYASMQNVRLQAAIAMAPSEDLRLKVAERAGVDEESLHSIEAKQIGSSTLVDLTISTDDRENAALMADSAAEQIAEEIAAINPTPPIQIHIITHAETPDELSARSSAIKSGILGVVFGVIISLCVGIAMILLDHTIRNATYVSKSLQMPCLGSFALKAEEEECRDEFRRMRAAVTQQVGEKGSLLLIPVHGKKGAGETACGLAHALTVAGRSVLYLEADFSGATQAAALGAGQSKGLVAALKDGSSPKEAAVSTKIEGLSFLSCGQAQGSSADLLASDAFSAFVKKASDEFDYVLCVLPDEENMPDADNAASVANGVLLVAEYGVTPFRDFEESLTRLRTAGGKISGFVLNGVR